MEAFEQLCKVSLESEGFAVSGNVKFPVRRRTRKRDRVEYQTHGYEVDLVGARSGALVLAEVKSYFGSRGVSRQAFRAIADRSKRSRASLFKLFNDNVLRKKVVDKACERYGYKPSQVHMRLYVGKFAGGHEHDVRAHLSSYRNPSVEVIDLGKIVDHLIELSQQRTYLDDPVLTTVKALYAAGRLAEPE